MPAGRRGAWHNPRQGKTEGRPSTTAPALSVVSPVGQWLPGAPSGDGALVGYRRAER
jgi:hypothetical protein